MTDTASPTPSEALALAVRAKLIEAFEPMCRGFGTGNIPHSIAGDFADAALTALGQAEGHSDALRQISQPDSGWRLVPIEPTEEMLCAPDDAGVGLYSRKVFATIYRAMLSAHERERS